MLPFLRRLTTPPGQATLNPVYFWPGYILASLSSTLRDHFLQHTSHQLLFLYSSSKIISTDLYVYSNAALAIYSGLHVHMRLKRVVHCEIMHSHAHRIRLTFRTHHSDHGSSISNANVSLSHWSDPLILLDFSGRISPHRTKEAIEVSLSLAELYTTIRLLERKDGKIHLTPNFINPPLYTILSHT